MIFSGHLLKPVDGDTYDFVCDVSHMDPERPIWKPRIRCAKINTPEHGQPGWLDAKTALIAHLTDKQLRIETFGRDSFKRLLAETWVEGEEESFSAWMLSQGWAAYHAIHLQLSE
jgi:endonuclease YncB( thermonuclease family)